MIIIKSLTGKLLFNDNGSYKAFPFSVYTNGDIVTVTAIGQGGGSISDDYRNWKKDDNSPFASAIALIEYLTPFSGCSVVP